jgi:vitamin B12/bleomycin/antimicrobial peptide transport system ATP-binding/permease protein
VIDEALDTVDEATRKCIVDLLNNELKETAVINIGRPAANDHFFTRVLQLIKEPAGRCFIPDLNGDGLHRAAEAMGNPAG